MNNCHVSRVIHEIIFLSHLFISFCFLHFLFISFVLIFLQFCRWQGRDLEILLTLVAHKNLMVMKLKISLILCLTVRVMVFQDSEVCCCFFLKFICMFCAFIILIVNLANIILVFVFWFLFFYSINLPVVMKESKLLPTRKFLRM